MKSVYSFGRRPAKRNYTLDDLQALKGSGKRLTMCNPANATEIKACVDAGIDLLTIWDDQIEEAREVAPNHFMGTGTTWGQYSTPDEILRSAIKCMEQGADMFYTLRSFDVIEMLAKEHIPVQSHIGLVPTLSMWSGGLRAFGRSADEALELHRTFKRYEDAGCFAVEVECIAEPAMNLLNDKTSLVTFAIGCGRSGDAVFVFVSDLCGESQNPPKHAHAFRNLAPLHQQIYDQRVAALKEFHNEVTAHNFPYAEQSISMHPQEEEKLQEALGNL